MEAGGKDRPPTLAPGNYVQWKSRIKRYIDTKPNNELVHYYLQNPPYKFKWAERTISVAEGSSETTTEGYMENYKNVSQDIRNQLDAEAEVKAVERLKQGESINVHDLETNLYWEFGKFTSRDGETLESYYSRFYKMMNELVRNQYDVTNHQVNVQFLLQLQPEWQRLQQAATRNRGKEIVNSPSPTYDQKPDMVTEDDALSKEKEIDKLMALISLSFKKIYKPTNNNLRNSSNTSRANQDNTLRINKQTGYDIQRAVNVVGDRENIGTHVLSAEQADWRDDTDDEPEDQELEAHYLYMAKIQEVTPNATENSGPIFDVEPLQKLVEIILFIVDSGCSTHMTRNIKLLCNFVEKFLGTVKFGNDQIASILGYGDLVQGNVTTKQVYYVEGLNHNLFSVGKFCDADLEVTFRKSTCYIRDLKGNDLLTGSRGTDLYSIILQDTSTPNLICLMAKASSSQAWLWHRRLSHLNFDTINLLSKYDIVTGLPKLKFIKDHLCSSCELGKAKQSINGKKYVLVIVDDYSRYTWTHFLRSKDETPEVLIDFLKLVQRGLHTQVRTVQTDQCTQFLNKTLHAYFAKEEVTEFITREHDILLRLFIDELPLMALDHVSFDPVPQCLTTALEQDSLSPGPQSQENVSHAAEIVTTSNEMDLLFSSMFD
ncbi:retrovirus-related pol polyprotein from transposon TNT 1-94 [Tanacetum coccineum]